MDVPGGPHEPAERAERLTADAHRLAYVDPRKGLELAIAAAAVAPHERRAHALLAAARCAACTEDFDAAARLAGEGLRSVEQHPVTGVRAGLLAGLADAAMRVGDLTEAHRRAAEALDRARAEEDEEGAAYGLWALGNVLFYLGEHGWAQTMFELAAALFDRLGETLRAGLMRGNAGEAQMRRGEVRAGRAALERSIETIGDRAPNARPRALLMLSEAVGLLGDTARALSLQDEALAEAVRLGRTDMEALAYAWRGWSLAAGGRHREARTSFEHGLGLARRVVFREAELEALLGLGTTDTRLGALDRAAAELEEAGALAATGRQRVQLGRAHRLLADVYETQGALERAYGHLRASIAVTELTAPEAAAGLPLPEEIVALWAPRVGCPHCGAREGRQESAEGEAALGRAGRKA